MKNSSLKDHINYLVKFLILKFRLNNKSKDIDLIFERFVNEVFTSCQTDKDITRTLKQLLPMVAAVNSCSRASSEGFYQNLPVYMGAGSPREEFLDLYRSLDYFDPVRILVLMNLVLSSNELKLGDYAEFGVFQGRSARLIHKVMDQTKDLYLFDTFLGLARSDMEREKEVLSEKEFEIIAGSVNFDPENEHVGYSGGTITKHFEKEINIEDVKKFVREARQGENIKIFKGNISDTLDVVKDKKFRFVHIDVDLYKPTLSALEFCWPRLVQGGTIAVHDIMEINFIGGAIAFKEFARKNNLKPVVMPDIWGTGVLIKQ